MNARKPRNLCKNCQKPVRRPINVFCAFSCQHEYHRKVFVQRWLDGNVEGGRIGGISSHIRRYMIEIHGEKCSACGWEQRNVRTGKVPLEVDHIDGNYKNNVPENLRLICPNCHSLTPTFRGLNRGNGREGRVTRPLSSMVER